MEADTKIVESLMRFPAIAGTSGSRLETYVTQLDIATLEHVLGHDPRSRNWQNLSPKLQKMYEKIQRSTAPQRIQGLINFIEQRLDPSAELLAALPSISVAIQKPSEFDNRSGRVIIDGSHNNTRIVVDGLGRVTALIEYLHHYRSMQVGDLNYSKTKATLENLKVPILFLSPKPGQEDLSLEEMGQLFFDFNFKQIAVPARIAISLDMGDLYIRLTNQLAADCPEIRDNGGMEKRASSLGSKSVALVAQTVLLKFVRGAIGGAKLQTSNKSVLQDDPLTAENFDDRLRSLCSFVSAFAKAMGERFTTNRKDMHLSAPGWQVLGLLANEALNTPEDLQLLATRLGQLDWSRKSEIWDGMAERDTEGNLLMTGAGMENKKRMLECIRRSLEGVRSESSQF